MFNVGMKKNGTSSSLVGGKREGHIVFSCIKHSYLGTYMVPQALTLFFWL